MAQSYPNLLGCALGSCGEQAGEVEGSAEGALTPPGKAQLRLPRLSDAMIRDSLGMEP